MKVPYQKRTIFQNYVTMESRFTMEKIYYYGKKTMILYWKQWNVEKLWYYTLVYYGIYLFFYLERLLRNISKHVWKYFNMCIFSDFLYAQNVKLVFFKLFNCWWSLERSWAEAIHMGTLAPVLDYCLPPGSRYVDWYEFRFRLIASGNYKVNKSNLYRYEEYNYA